MKKDNWIDVKTQLPVTGTRVLAFCKTPNNGMCVAECWFKGNEFLHEFLLYGQYSVYVSHWLDLPENPDCTAKSLTTETTLNRDIFSDEYRLTFF